MKTTPKSTATVSTGSSRGRFTWKSRRQNDAPSITAAGLDPANLPEADKSKMNFGSGGNMEKKAWKDIWGCGQGIGVVKAVDYLLNVNRGYRMDLGRRVVVIGGGWGGATAAKYLRLHDRNIDVTLIESIDPLGPFGAKEVGEGPIVVTMSAVANAVANALGGMMGEIPMTPWRVLRAMRARDPTRSATSTPTRPALWPGTISRRAPSVCCSAIGRT